MRLVMSLLGFNPSTSHLLSLLTRSGGECRQTMLSLFVPYVTAAFCHSYMILSVRVIVPFSFTLTLVLSSATAWKLISLKHISLWCCSLDERKNKYRRSHALLLGKGSDVGRFELMPCEIGLRSSKGFR